jgi:bacillithiol system protein YtxJ
MWPARRNWPEAMEQEGTMTRESATGGGFAPLRETEALEGAIERSHDAPVILYLHDRGCPISLRAWGEMQDLPGEVQAQTLLVDVTRDHGVKRAIAERTGVRHESPQVLVLRHGRAAWHASHFAITADAVTEAVTSNA